MKRTMGLIAMIGVSGCLSWTAASASPSNAPRSIGHNVAVSLEYPASFAAAASPSERVAHAGATFVKLHFRDFSMPPGAFVELADRNGAVLRRYDARGPRGNGEFWALSVDAAEAVVTVQGDPDRRGTFTIDTAGVGTEDASIAPEVMTLATDGVRGLDDREDVRCYSTESGLYAHSRSVARLRFFDHTTNLWASCTGFLVSCQSHLMTSYECAPDQRTVDTLEARFNLERDACGSTADYPGEGVAGDSLVDADAALGFSLLTLSDRPSAIYEYLELSGRLPWTAERVYIPQFPGGVRKVVAAKDDQSADRLCRVGSVAGGEIGFTCDIGEGGGGSPLIDYDTGAVSALARPGSFGPAESSANAIKPIRDRLRGQLPRCAQVILEADRDSYVHSGSPTTNYGDLASLKVGWTYLGAPGAARGLIHFGLGTLPYAAEIQTAQFRLSANQREGNAVEVRNELRRILAPWVEAAVTWNTTPPVGEIVGTYVAPQKSYFRQRADLTDEVRRWFDGSVQNHGLQIADPSAEANNDHSFSYVSRGCCTSSDRPIVTVNYLTICRSDADCTDGNICTDDTCANPGLPGAACVFTPVPGRSCGDTNACTTGDTCDANGACSGSGVRVCDDLNPCTDDACNPAFGCTHVPVTGRSCTDGDACTGGDTCNASGSCAGGAAIGCDDGNPCTDDFCDWRSGCTHEPASGRACSDGNACTKNDRCDATGACVGGAGPNCDDGNACSADACDLVTGACVHTALPDTDGDRLCDAIDNCPAANNPGQSDDDGDRVGNACDDCLEIWNPDQRNGAGYVAGDSCSDAALFRRANMDLLEFSTGRVDGRDLRILAACYGMCPGDPGWTEDCGRPNLNLSPDGCISGEDLHLFMNEFGTSH